MRELSLNVMDVAQNSISAGASLITIEAQEDSALDRLVIRVLDNGCGMTKEQVKRVTDPFYTTRTTRRVGLGIPLFQMEAEMTGGSLEISSEPGKGTQLTAVFVPSHIDMIPLGDLEETIHLLITCNPQIDFIYRRGLNARAFTVDTRELRGLLGNEVPLNSPEVSIWLREYLIEQKQSLEDPDLPDPDKGGIF